MSSWQPSTSIDNLKKRANLMMAIRQFFNERGYLEVETPQMSAFGITDVYLSNIKAFFRDRPYYLQTSPEYHMKRLLASGSGPIFQLARVFRDDELGRWHNPEFTLLEWYQLNVDHHELMDEMDVFLQQILNTKPMLRKTYRQAFLEICDIDPLNASLVEFKTLLKQAELDEVLSEDEEDRDQYLFLIMSHLIEPALADFKEPVAIYDFPASQASLAKVNNGVAERFEIYYQGIELANGFHELTDASAQEQRFKNDIQKRRELKLEEPTFDTNLLSALKNGLPACSGVALGIDRLLALRLGKNSISDVLSFDFSRA